MFLVLSTNPDKALTKDDPGLFAALQPYAGTDATPALKSGTGSGGLGQLLGREHLICAKFVGAARRRMTAAELQKHNKLPSKARRQKRPRRGETD